MPSSTPPPNPTSPANRPLELSITLVADKQALTGLDPIAVTATILNPGPNAVTMLWDEPRFRTWVVGGLEIDTLGWQIAPLRVVIPPGSVDHRRIEVVPTRDIPILNRGRHEVAIRFVFDPPIGSRVENTTVDVVSDSPGMTVRAILERAQAELDERYLGPGSTTRIDRRGVDITDHVSRDQWTVTFSNEGPIAYGVTEINVDKRTGVTSLPIYR